MTAGMIINKVVITEEAAFDYEEIICLKMPKLDIKGESEQYINYMQKSGRLLSDYYFRAKYYDEVSEEMMMLFFYKGEKFGTMQMWYLKGVCLEKEWDHDLEDDGSIRIWLNSGIRELPQNDWVLEYRENLKRGLIGSGMPSFTLSGLPKEVLSAIYSGEDSAIIERLSNIKRKNREWVGYKRYLPKCGNVRKKHKRTPGD
jgi:hypothetical protein